MTTNNQNDNGNPDSHEIKKAKIDLKSACLVALFSAVAATGASFLSGMYLVESTMIPAKISAKTACITAVNNQEQLFRDKAYQFQSSVGNFMANVAIMEPPTGPDFDKSAKDAIVQGYALTSYAPPELSLLAGRIAGSIKTMVSTTTSAQDFDKAGKIFNKALADWFTSFNTYMKSYDSLRAKCDIELPDHSPAS